MINHFLDQLDDWDEGPWSSPSLPHVMLYKWCSDWCSPRAFGTHSQSNHICLTKKNIFLFDATHPIIIFWKSIKVISYFIVREPTPKSMGTRMSSGKMSSRKNSQWKLHYGINLALSTIDKTRDCSATWDDLSALTLQQGDNYLSTLSHHMVMMLQTLWTMVTMPQCWAVLYLNCYSK